MLPDVDVSVTRDDDDDPHNRGPDICSRLFGLVPNTLHFHYMIFIDDMCQTKVRREISPTLLGLKAGGHSSVTHFY